MRWRILGPVEVSADGTLLAVRRPQQRAVLALLLLNADRMVSTNRLIEALWAENPPTSARTQVQVCVSQLRSVLRTAGLDQRLTSQAGGYRLTVDPDRFDLAEFGRAVEQARAATTAGRPEAAAELLRAGLDLWRGPALGGATGAYVPAAAAALEEQRLAAYEQLAAVELTLGRHTGLLRTLGALAATNPLREVLIGQYMLALAGAGQQSRALQVYAETRQRLAEELGVEPAAGLAAVHLRVLRQEVPVAPPDDRYPVRNAPDQHTADRTDHDRVPAAGPAPAAADVPAGRVPRTAAAPGPAQLPNDVAGFAGREAALRALDTLLPADGDPGGGRAVVISAIGGTAGVGKTALAVHWAHRVAHLFPDGQLYVNLRGFDLNGRSVAPGEALRGFLEALQVAAQRIPADLDRQAALYRTLLAGRRVLVLLDNARDPEQVRDLLPGAHGCLVLVTSRNRLTGLVATEGARPLTLDLLSADESRELLTHRIGRHRVAAEPHAVDEIVDRCARLPLALAIAAARAATYPEHPLARLAAELGDAHGDRLAAFDIDDPATDVRAVFSWSYRALDDATARMFRLLGLHPGPDVGQSALASLAGRPLAQVRPLLARLTRAHLLVERSPGRYSLHDLLRSYAAELCQTLDDVAQRAAARQRLLDHYLHTTYAADQLLDRYRLAHPVPPVEPRPGVSVEHPGDHARATQWFVTEHPVLLAAVRQAAEAGLDAHAWQLAAVLTTYLDRRGHWPDLVTVHGTALAAAQRRGDPLGQAQAHRGLAIASTWLGRTDDAHRHYRHAFELHRELGDRTGEAHTLIGISWVFSRQGRHQEALERTEEALAKYRAVGYRVGQAKALNNLGWLHARVGNHQLALDCCRQALLVHEETGNQHGAALTWDSLGYAHHELAEYGQATRCYHRALEVHRALGDRYDEGEVLANLGDTRMAAGDPVAGRTAWQQALVIFDELNHPDADQLRARLAEAYLPAAPGRAQAVPG